MTNIAIYRISASEVIGIVHELRALGLIQGVDFEFKYHAATLDLFAGDAYHKHTIFSFADPATASWFILKYQYEIQQ